MVSIQHIDVDSLLSQNLVEPWLINIVDNEGFILGDLTIVLGTDEWLLEYNKSYLDHDYFTDIITFDYVENNVISGDLLISIERVGANANSLNVSRETELKRVVIHGVLHLCGYNDKSPSDVEIMRKKEDFYLNLL
jgi:rRNA maturation RNase YbeY